MYLFSRSSKVFITTPYAPNSVALIFSRTLIISFSLALFPVLNKPGSWDLVMVILSGRPGNTNGLNVGRSSTLSHPSGNPYSEAGNWSSRIRIGWPEATARWRTAPNLAALRGVMTMVTVAECWAMSFAMSTIGMRWPGHISDYVKKAVYIIEILEGPWVVGKDNKQRDSNVSDENRQKHVQDSSKIDLPSHLRVRQGIQANVRSSISRLLKNRHLAIILGQTKMKRWTIIMGRREYNKKYRGLWPLVAWGGCLGSPGLWIGTSFLVSNSFAEQILILSDPPSSIALFAISASSLPFFLLSFPSSPSSIKHSTAFFTSSFFTSTSILSSSPKGTGLSTPILTPIFKISTINVSLINWSAKCGHVTIGNPAHTASSVEFHPQWVKKPPTARCDIINTCGAHPWTINPRSLTLSSKPSSENHFSSSSILSLTHHMKGLFIDSSPSPNSIICCVEARVRLPKQTYTTDPGSLPSSHFKQSCSLMVALFPLSAISELSLLHNETGPIHHTLEDHSPQIALSSIQSSPTSWNRRPHACTRARSIPVHGTPAVECLTSEPHLPSMENKSLRLCKMEAEKVPGADLPPVFLTVQSLQIA
ncbi:hypothetical protein LXL04_005093 [Taraxacum kok-saghyz]